MKTITSYCNRIQQRFKIYAAKPIFTMQDNFLGSLPNRCDIKTPKYVFNNREIGFECQVLLIAQIKIISIPNEKVKNHRNPESALRIPSNATKIAART